MNTKSIGKIGEDIACEYLVNNGYRVLIRNWREKWDEIDVIGITRDEILVFFEVKTLNSGIISCGLSPEDNMTQAKLNKLKRACETFAAKNQNLINENKGWRIDLLAINLAGSFPKIKHYENI